MVRVIKNNIIECRNCGSTLEYSPSDVWRVYSPPRGPYEMEGVDHYFIRCPDPCSARAEIPVSPDIANKVREIEIQEGKRLI